MLKNHKKGCFNLHQTHIYQAFPKTKTRVLVPLQALNTCCSDMWLGEKRAYCTNLGTKKVQNQMQPQKWNYESNTISWFLFILNAYKTEEIIHFMHFFLLQKISLNRLREKASSTRTKIFGTHPRNRQWDKNGKIV